MSDGEIDEDAILRIKAFDIDTVQSAINSSDIGEKAIVEILAELADSDLGVDISERELKMLIYTYKRLYLAKDFVDLQDLLLQDMGADLFFRDIRTVVRVLDPNERAEAWLEIFRGFNSYLVSGLADPTEWTEELAALANNFVVFYYQRQLLAHNLKHLKTYYLS